MNEYENISWFEKFAASPKYKLARHACLQVLLMLVSTNACNSGNGYGFDFTPSQIVSWLTYYLSLNAICYLNMYVLAPKFLYTRQMNKYIGCIVLEVIALFAIIAVFSQLDDNTMPLYISLIIVLSSFLSIAFFIFATSSLMLFHRWIEEQRRAGELETATMQSELKFLKRQINPHFLFNMINNANVLLKRRPDEASRVLFKLEDLLRYQFKDSAQENVSLSSDIRFLNDFLNLEKIRRDRFEFSINTEGKTDGITLPPLLFIPFVENAVKHNSDNQNMSYVHINFKVENKKISFCCENSKPQKSAETENQTGGIGMQNISRRLQLLYPDRHTLHIENKQNTFTVNLEILL